MSSGEMEKIFTFAKPEPNSKIENAKRHEMQKFLSEFLLIYFNPVIWEEMSLSSQV